MIAEILAGEVIYKPPSLDFQFSHVKLNWLCVKRGYDKLWFFNEMCLVISCLVDQPFMIQH